MFYGDFLTSLIFIFIKTKEGLGRRSSSCTKAQEIFKEQETRLILIILRGRCAPELIAVVEDSHGPLGSTGLWFGFGHGDWRPRMRNCEIDLGRGSYGRFLQYIIFWVCVGMVANLKRMLDELAFGGPHLRLGLDRFVGGGSEEPLRLFFQRLSMEPAADYGCPLFQELEHEFTSIHGLPHKKLKLNREIFD